MHHSQKADRSIGRDRGGDRAAERERDIASHEQFPQPLVELRVRIDASIRGTAVDGETCDFLRRKPAQRHTRERDRALDLARDRLHDDAARVTAQQRRRERHGNSKYCNDDERDLGFLVPHGESD